MTQDWTKLALWPPWPSPLTCSHYPGHSGLLAFPQVCWAHSQLKAFAIAVPSARNVFPLRMTRFTSSTLLGLFTKAFSAPFLHNTALSTPRMDTPYVFFSILITITFYLDIRLSFPLEYKFHHNRFLLERVCLFIAVSQHLTVHVNEWMSEWVNFQGKIRQRSRAPGGKMLVVKPPSSLAIQNGSTYISVGSDTVGRGRAYFQFL